MIQDTLPVDLNILKLTASGKAHYCWVHFCRHRLKVDGSSGPGGCPKSVIVISTAGRNPFFVQISQSRSSPRSRRGSFEMTNMAYKTASGTRGAVDFQSMAYGRSGRSRYGYLLCYRPSFFLRASTKSEYRSFIFSERKLLATSPCQRGIAD